LQNMKRPFPTLRYVFFFEIRVPPTVVSEHILGCTSIHALLNTSYCLHKLSPSTNRTLTTVHTHWSQPLHGNHDRPVTARTAATMQNLCSSVPSLALMHTHEHTQTQHKDVLNILHRGVCASRNEGECQVDKSYVCIVAQIPLCIYWVRERAEISKFLR
jgi:hypothetical protein